MQIGIRFRLISIVITLLIIIIASYSTIAYHLEKKTLLHQMEENAFTLSRVLSDSIIKVGEIKEKVKLQDLIKLVSLTEGIFEIDIYDENGKIIFDTFERRIGTTAKSPEVYEVLKKGYFLSHFRAYKEEIGLEFEEKVFRGIYPLILEGKIIGAVAIAFEIYDYLTADEETKKVIYKEMEKNARILGETVAYAIKNIMEIENFVKVEGLINTIVENSAMVAEINILDSGRKVILSSQKENIGKIINEKHPLSSRFVRKEEKFLYEIFLPVKVGESVRTINIFYNSYELYADLKRSLNYNVLLATLSLVVATIIFFFLSTQLTRPIERLVRATEVISAGDLEHRIDWKSKDELGRLATSFNVMAQSLKDTLEKMTKSAKLAAVGQLAAGIAHELRNPLSVIKNSIYFINTRLKTGDEKIAKHISMINTEIDISEKIISNLLDFSRSSAGQLLPVQINEILETVFSFLTLPANVIIKKELETRLPMITGDPDQLRQVFLNFILNAFDAMPKGGELKVTTKSEGNTAEITFTDTGCGITKENLDKIFDPFFTTKSKGTGLGLAISHKIIEEHNGVIEVESEINKGTTFNIKLPINKGEV